MNFSEAITWLYSFEQYGSKLGLERITELVHKLKNPQDNLDIIHVTGTNGKGSVCKFIGSILQQAGYTVGVYLSPHLQRFSERMTINNVEISEENIAQLVAKIKPVVEEMIDQGTQPTFFEIVTAMAFHYFSDHHVDYAVIEVGLGGRFDATNVVSPQVSVITNISLEHTDRLGDTIQAIAFEKAGIIKDHIPVVTAAETSAREVIEKVAAEKNAPVKAINRDIWKRVAADTKQQEFLIHGLFKDYTVTTALLGEFQGENIALALTTVEQLQMNGVYITDADIVKGILAAFNPGRMEIFSEKPTVLLDGAHNPAGIEMLKKTLNEDFTYDQLILILGILKDKDIDKMVATIVPLADSIIVTKSSNARACDPIFLKEKIENPGYARGVFVEESLPNAIEHARVLAQKNDMICITGSLFTVGEARTYLVAPSLKKRYHNANNFSSRNTIHAV
jgi:dihydrofolate synthase/folylpolyglutamate synthase